MGANPSRGRDLARAEDAFRGGDLRSADELLRRLLRREPANSRANELMAYVAGNRGDLERAFKFLAKATSVPDASDTSWYYLGSLFLRQGRYAEAVDALRKALVIRPAFFEALHDLGLASFKLGGHAEAIEAYDRAAALDPKSFEVFHNRARALQALHRHDEALADFDRALESRPDDAGTWANRGEVLNDLRRYDECLEAYARALSLDPGNADAHWNESLTRLVLGQFELGWLKYEYRWKGERAWPRRHAEIPAWTGATPVEGKRILVWREQGFGDTLQFCRYAPLLAARGAEVILEVQPALAELIASVGGCTVIAEGARLPECDLQIPLLSLPLAFKTSLDTIPSRVPYLSASRERIEAWAPRLERADARPKVGIACAGQIAQKDDRQRSIALQHFTQLEDLANLYLIPPQLKADDERFLRESGSRIRYLGRDVADFSDSAAIVAQMDLVITIDTSLAHLAGALAKPVWILLPWTPTWRWLVDRADSPWYPTAKLFRQARIGDWDGVMGQVRDALSKWEIPCC